MDLLAEVALVLATAAVLSSLSATRAFTPPWVRRQR